MGVFIAQQTTICLARERVISDQYIKFIWLNSHREVAFEPVEAPWLHGMHLGPQLVSLGPLECISEHFTKWEGASFLFYLTSALGGPLWYVILGV